MIPKFDIFSQDSSSSLNFNEDAPIEESFAEEFQRNSDHSNLQEATESEVNYFASEDFRSPFTFLNAVHGEERAKVIPNRHKLLKQLLGHIPSKHDRI